MPLATIASAVWWINASLTLQPNEFQSSQPIGGVRATPLFSAQAGRAPASWSTTKTNNTAADWPAARPMRLRDRGFGAWKTPAGDMMALLVFGRERLTGPAGGVPVRR